MTRTSLPHCRGIFLIHPNAYSPQRSSGFTLIELLVAMVIFAVMMAGVHALFSSFQTVKERTDIEAARLGDLQRAFRFMSKDIRQIVPRPVRDEYGSADRLPALSSSFDTIEFTKTGWNKPPFVQHQRSELQRVKYVWEEGSLKRFYWNVLDRAEDSRAQTLVLIEEVEEVTYKFYHKNDQGDLQEERDWPPLSTGNTQATAPLGNLDCGIGKKEEVLMPLVIEVLIKLKDIGEVSRKFLLPNEYDVALFTAKGCKFEP